MGNVFAAAEIIKMGIEIEKNGKEFYSRAIQTAASETAAKMFRHLYDEELHHVDVFMKMLAAAGDYEPSESEADEYGRYLRSVAREHVFKQDNGSQMAATIKNDLQAIELALGFERSSILFYENMKKFVPGGEHGSVDKIIAQEQDHIRKLNELKAALVK